MALTTVNSGGIKDDSIVNADIKSDAAIATSKLATGVLPSGLVVNGSNIAAGSIATGHIAAGTGFQISNSNVSDSAAIALSKLASTPAVLTGSTNNTITTVTSANNIQGEANLSFDGNTLFVTGANGDLLKLNSAGTETQLYLDNNEFRVRVDSDNDEASSIYSVEIDGTLALRLHSGGDIHLGNWSNQSTVYGKARVNIRGADDIATSFNLANSYLHIGGQESTLNGLYPISFGHAKADSTKASSYIGAKVTDSGAYEKTALVFATRDVTTDSVPTERVRVNTKGSTISYGPRYGIYTETGIETINGGTKNVQYLVDDLGIWIVVAKIQQASHLQAAMASVAQIDTSTDQATGTEWSSSFGDLYTTAVRYTASSNWDEWRDYRGCDFIHGVPHGRPWKQFFTSGNNNAFQSDGTKSGWTCKGAWDGKNRWHNPNYTFCRLSDAGGTQPSINQSFFGTPTASDSANALNMWGDRYDAKFTVHHENSVSGQDTQVTAGWGYDDNHYGHEDNFSSSPSDLGTGGATTFAAMPLWISLNVSAVSITDH